MEYLKTKRTERRAHHFAPTGILVRPTLETDGEEEGDVTHRGDQV
jgi:hypothetical protein